MASRPDEEQRKCDLQALVALIRQDSVEGVKSFLNSHSINLNMPDPSGRTCISFAAKKGDNALIQILIRNGAELNSFDFYHQTPLHYAAHEGHVQTTKLLLSQGSDVNAIKSLTPLHIAALKDHQEIAKILLEAEADVNVESKMGVTPLHCAASNGHGGMVHLLLEHGAAINAFGKRYKRTALMIAVEGGDLTIVEDLVTHGARLNMCDHYGYSALTTACLHNFTDIAAYLIKRGARVNVPDNKCYLPLHYAARCGNSRLVALLLDKESHLDKLTKFGDSALHLSANQGHVDVAHLLVEHGCDTNKCASSGELRPLHTAVMNLLDTEVFNQVLDVLVAGGCDLDACANTTWRTALFCAVDQTKSGFALSLISHGANARVEDEHGITLLHKACVRNMLSLIYTLVLGGLVDWSMEGWLDRDIFDSGVNPNLLKDYQPNIPPSLLKNTELFFDIMGVRHNPLTLASLARRVIRATLKNKLKLKLDMLILPQRLKNYILLVS